MLSSKGLNAYSGAVTSRGSDTGQAVWSQPIVRTPNCPLVSRLGRRIQWSHTSVACKTRLPLSVYLSKRSSYDDIHLIGQDALELCSDRNWVQLALSNWMQNIIATGHHDKGPLIPLCASWHCKDQQFTSFNQYLQHITSCNMIQDGVYVCPRHDQLESIGTQIRARRHIKEKLATCLHFAEKIWRRQTHYTPDKAVGTDYCPEARQTFGLGSVDYPYSEKMTMLQSPTSPAATLGYDRPEMCSNLGQNSLDSTVYQERSISGLPRELEAMVSRPKEHELYQRFSVPVLPQELEARVSWPHGLGASIMTPKELEGPVEQSPKSVSTLPPYDLHDKVLPALPQVDTMLPHPFLKESSYHTVQVPSTLEYLSTPPAHESIYSHPSLLVDPQLPSESARTNMDGGLDEDGLSFSKYPLLDAATSADRSYCSPEVIAWTSRGEPRREVGSVSPLSPGSNAIAAFDQTVHESMINASPLPPAVLSAASRDERHAKKTALKIDVPSFWQRHPPSFREHPACTSRFGHHPYAVNIAA